MDFNRYNFQNGQQFGYPFSPYFNYYNQSNFQPQNQQPIATNTNKIFVSSIDDVKKRDLPFNSDFLFLDNEKPLLYQKIVDSKGQFEVKTFDIVPHNDTEQQKDSGSIDLSAYVLKSDFEALESKIKGIEEQLPKTGVVS